MTNDVVIGYFKNRPFVSFVATTVDGRRFEVRHPEQATFGLRGETVLYMHEDDRLEAIDSRLIVSLATLEPADFDTFGG